MAEQRRKRRSAPPGDFSDPLSNYEQPAYVDDFERALTEDEVSQLQHQPFMAVPPSTTVEQALRTMADLDIACLMIAEGDRLVGILSERDVVNKILDTYEKIKDQPVSAVMTPDPVTVHETESPAKALNLMAVGGFRHIPLLDVDEKIVGIVGPRRVTAYLQDRVG